MDVITDKGLKQTIIICDAEGAEAKETKKTAEGPVCDSCGSVLTRQGDTYLCTKCGLEYTKADLFCIKGCK